MKFLVPILAGIILLHAINSAAQSPLVQFKFVDAPLDLVIKQLNKSSLQNYRLAKDVKEKVNLERQPLPLDQAIDILKSEYSLVEVKRGDEVWLERRKPINLTKQREKQSPSKRAHKYSNKEAESQQLRVYQPQHYNARELASLLDARQGGILSSTSYVLEEAIHNKLIVKASQAEHSEVEKLLNSIDQPQQTVRVYSRIVIARKQAQHELGTRLGLRSTDTYTALAGGTKGAFLGPDATNVFENNLAVDFGTVATGGNIALGYKDGLSLLELELQALDYSGLVDIVATPQVLVTSGQLAYIATGTQVPYVQNNQDNIDVLFKDALLSLQVTPRVENDNRIDMSIQFAMDTVGSLYNGIPAIDTNKLVTRVKIKPGQTLVLGGIFSKVVSDTEQKVPGLGDIPVLGWLFRHQAKKLEEAELLVFLTPQLPATH